MDCKFFKRIIALIEAPRIVNAFDLTTPASNPP
jgi:hypothetical protein